MSDKIRLNYEYYPLVVGQLEKYSFRDWEVEGGNVLLEAYVTDESFGAQDVTWTSSDETTAVVEAGKVHALRTGRTVITAALPDGSAATCHVQVIDNPGRLTCGYVTLNTNRLVLNKTEGAVLHPNVLPVDYFGDGRLDHTFRWETSDPSVAQVDHRGRVYAVSEGEAVITGSSMDVGRRVSCQVTVIRKPDELLLADPFEDMDGGSFSLSVGQELELSLPEEVQDQPVYWCSEDESSARVSPEGRVFAYRAGLVPIWATFVNGGFRVRYEVAIQPVRKEKAERITLNERRLRFAPGEELTLHCTVFPATLLERRAIWISSDESVVRCKNGRINLSGLDEITLEAVGEGSATITAKVDGLEQTCQVVVAQASPEELAVTLPEELSLEPTETMHLEPKGEKLPTRVEFVWFSEDEKVCRVDEYGIVVGVSKGETTVCCRPVRKGAGELQGEVARCKVRVTEDGPYLYHLSVPQETITHESVILTWNRDSRNRCEGLAGYEVRLDGEKVAFTDRLFCQVSRLAPETSHSFEVLALGREGEILSRRQVTVTTTARPKQVLNVLEAPYHAVGDGICSDTWAIQRAIDDCPEGGEVLIPEGAVCVSGALFLKSNMTFRVDGILFGSDVPEDYPEITCRWEGYRKLKLTEENAKATYPVFEHNVYSHSSLINVGVFDEGEAACLSPYNTENVTICGKGMINGNGFTLAHNEGPCWFVQKKGLPIPQSPKRDQNVRGRVIAVYNAKHVLLSDLTVAYGPAWTIHPVFCDGVTLHNLKVVSMGNGRTGVMEGMLILNGDGVDPDSSLHVNVIGCTFTVGDDAVAVKSGRNRQGNELAKPSAYIRVTDCKSVDSKGAFCIGSEQAGGAHDVLFQNLEVERVLHFGLWIKSSPSRGGLVEHVDFKDCVLKKTGGALQIEYNHGGNEDPSLVPPHTRNVTFENVTFVGKHKFGIRIIGIADSPIHHVKFRACRFAPDFVAKKDRKFHLKDCHHVDVSDVVLPDGYDWE